MYDKKKTKFITILSVLFAIEIIVAVTPLGSLPAFGPIVMTLAHIPVIVGSVILGLRGGVIMGSLYGLLSVLVWTFMPPSPIAFIFTPFYSLGDISGNFYSLIISFLPRILIGVLSYLFIFVFFKKVKNLFIKTFFGAFIGNLISSIILLVFVYIFFGPEYSNAIGVEYNALYIIITTTILTSAIPESILGGFVAYGVSKIYKDTKVS